MMLLLLVTPVFANGGGTPVASNPQYANPIELDTSIKTSYLNITWTAEYNWMTEIRIEHNFTGIPVNDTVWTGSTTPVTVNEPYIFNASYHGDKYFYWKSYGFEEEGVATGVSSTYTFYVNSSAYADSTYPTYSDALANTTWVGEPIRLFTAWDSYQLESAGQYMFSTNFTGSWVNQSWTNFTSTPELVYYDTVLPSTQGVYGWCVYAKDNVGNENNTMCENPNVMNVYDSSTKNCTVYYQENATSQSAVGDWSSPSNFYDGNWATSGSRESYMPSGAYYTANYMIPSYDGFLESVTWQVKYDNQSSSGQYSNVTLPMVCWQGTSFVNPYVNSTNGCSGGCFTWRCYDFITGTYTSDLIGSTGGEGRWYEEGIYWEFCTGEFLEEPEEAGAGYTPIQASIIGIATIVIALGTALIGFRTLTSEGVSMENIIAVLLGTIVVVIFIGAIMLML